MRAFLITNRFAPSQGGIEHQSALLASSLSKLGIAATILTDKFRYELATSETIEGVAVYRVWRHE